MKIKDIIVEADPAKLGPMNDKMKSVLDKVHTGDVKQAQADAEAKAKAKADQRAEAARLRKENPEMLQQYIDMLKKHDWTYEYSDGYSRAYVKGQEEHYDIMNMAKKIDPDLEIYNKYDPLKKENIGEKMKDSGIDEASEPGEYRTIRGVKYYIVKNKSGKSKGFSGPTPAAKKYAQSGGGQFEDIDEMSAGNVAASMGGGNGFVNGIGTTQRRGTSSKKKRRKSKS